MKKRLLTICTLTALALTLIPAAVAAKEAAEAAKDSGFYGVQAVTPDTTKLTPMAADQTAGIPGQSVIIDGQTVVQHPNSVRFAIEMQGEPNGMYFVQVDEGDLAKPDLDKSVYVNQYTADSAGKVSSGTGTEAPYPGTLIAGKTYSVFANNEKVATLKYFGAGVKVTGQVTSYNGRNPVTVTLFDTGTATEKGKVEIPGFGTAGQSTQTFSFDSVPAGTYDILVTKAGHLDSKILKLKVGDQMIDLSQDYSVVMIPGNLNGDDFVNTDDLAILIKTENYDMTLTKADNKLSDLDGDTYVNTDDLAILIKTENYDKSEEENTTVTYVAPAAP